MTVETSISKSGPYAGAGTTGPFTVNFRFLDQTHLRVIRTDGTGEHVLVLNTDYTVAGVGNPTGSVTLAAALPVGQTLTIIRNVPKTQEADYVQNDDFPAQSHEDALDKLTMITQQVQEVVDRTVTFPASDSASATAELPVASLRANNLLGFDATGKPVAVIPSSQSAAALQTLLATSSGASMVGATDGAGGSVFTTIAGFIAKIISNLGSSIVGFLQSGTGAVSRTVQSEFRDLAVNVKQFGAIGDGNSHPLSAFFGSLSAAQVVYPHATALTDEIDWAAWQAAVNSLQSTGGDVYAPRGTYRFNRQLQVGNGTNIALSTYRAVVLRGDGAGGAPGPGNPAAVKIKAAFTGPAILIQGSIAGWGIENIFIEADTTSTSASGVRIESGQFGRMKNVVMSGFYGTSMTVTANAMTLSNNNSYENVMIWLPPAAASAVGLVITGNGATGGSNGTAFDSWYNLTITINNVGQTGLVLQYCDNIQFFTLQIINAANGTGIQFNYSSTGTNGNTFPCDNHFYGLDVYGNSITNVTPSGIGSIATPNRMYGFSLTNAATQPNLPNLSVLNESGTSKSVIYLNGAQSIGAASTKVAFDTKTYDNDTIADVSVNRRITPTRKGYYLVEAQMTVGSFAGASVALCTITKNGGTQHAQGTISNNGTAATSRASTIIFFNGSTDYVEVFGLVTGGSTALTAGAQNTFLALMGPF